MVKDHLIINIFLFKTKQYKYVSKSKSHVFKPSKKKIEQAAAAAAAAAAAE